jgi:hypothetical protein
LRFPQVRLSPEEILRAFCVWDVHGCQLENLPPDDPSSKIRWTAEYDRAKETLFPLANGPYVSCLQCQSERQSWIFENPELCRILRCKTTYEELRGHWRIGTSVPHNQISYDLSLIVGFLPRAKKRA